jgi:hypothetical protein
VLARYGGDAGGCGADSLRFSGSNNQGSSWTEYRIQSTCGQEIAKRLKGFGLAAGRGGDVVVAYGLDSWDPYFEEEESRHDYTVQVARSVDFGTSFVYGAADGYSTDLPDGSVVLHDPDIKIGRSGTAHLVYGQGGKAILYKYSLRSYGTWSAKPVRLDDDVLAANVRAPRIAVSACENTSILHAAWVQSLSGTNRALYTRKVAQPGYRWSRPLKIDKPNIGTSLSGLAATGAKAFATFSSPLFGSRVWSGVTCR